MKKKIFICILSLSIGGAERSLVNLLNELPQDKYIVDLLLFKSKGAFLSQVPSNINILETPLEIKKLYSPILKAGKYFPYKLIGTGIGKVKEQNTKSYASYRWKNFYSKIINPIKKKYDLAIAYTADEMLYFADEKVNATKKIVFVHTDYKTARRPHEYDKPHFQNMDYIVSISNKCVDVLKKEFPEFFKKIILLPNITSSRLIKQRADEFYPIEYKKEIVKLISIGRLSEEKGFDLAIQAADLMKSKGLRFKWYIVGEGKLKTTLEKQIQKKNVSDCFILLGSRENPYPYIKNCDIVVQPSRYEGKSVVLDEAKILAKPIIATNYPTAKDQIKENEGLIVEMSPKGISDGLEKMMKDEQLRQHISAYLASHEYGNQDEVDKYMNLID